MKHSTSLACALLLCINVFCQTPSHYDWVIRDSSSLINDIIFNSATDKDGDVYIVGRTNYDSFLGDTSFSTPGIFNYVAKMDPDGNILWVTKTTGSIDITSSTILVDDDKKCYIGGYFIGTVHLGAITLTASCCSGTSSYSAVIDSNGNWISATRYFSGDSFLNEIKSVRVTADHDVINMETRELPLSFTKTNFILNRKNTTGPLLTKSFGNVNANLAFMDADENSYVYGYYDTTITINGGIKVPNASKDIYFAKLNTGLTFSWVKTFSSNGSDVFSSINTGDDGIYIAGSFAGDSLQIGDTTLYNASPGTAKQYILKMDFSGNLINIKSDTNTPAFTNLRVNAADDHIFSIVTISEATTFGTVTLTPVSAPDLAIVEMDNDFHVLKAHLAITTVSGSIITYSRKLIIPDIIYDAGYYKGTVSFGDHTFSTSAATNMDGFIYKLRSCDISSTITPSGALTFCKGASVILSASAGSGYTYQWKKDGVNIADATFADYHAAKTGSYSVLISSGDCVVESSPLAVTVNPKPKAVITAPMGTDLCGLPSVKLKANNGSGFSYQWIKDGTVIAGANSQLYAVSSIGNYAVKVTNATGCSKISVVTNVFSSCKSGNQETNKISIYPNPSSGIFLITGISCENVSISIENMMGASVYFSDLGIAENGYFSKQLELQDILESGMYVATINAGLYRETAKIIIVK